eukprot:SM002882S10731  [mRNA]  locus=s2882:2:1624:- [translate_table: standard]
MKGPLVRRCAWLCAHGAAWRLHSAAATSARSERPAVNQAVVAKQSQPLQERARSTSSLASYARRVEECNCGQEFRSHFQSFEVDDQVVGYMHREFVALLVEESQGVFQTVENKGSFKVVMSRSLSSMQLSTDATAAVLQRLRSKGVITGWRDELYPASVDYHSPPLLLIERAAAPLFGIKAYGVHMNGFVKEKDGAKLLWVARRSLSKQTYPGRLDHLAAGGQVSSKLKAAP